MTRHPLPVNARQQRHYARDRGWIRPVADPYATAVSRSKRFTSAEDRNHFMDVFERTRFAEMQGRDTYPALAVFERYNDHVGVAAYIEAMASTRPVGWAQ